MKYPKHKIIFEGAELAGKSYLMSQVYNFLEPKYNTGGHILDGCNWFNLDVGVYGTDFGPKALNRYMDLFEDLAGANIMAEKFHITETVYQKIYNNIDFDYSVIEDRLKKLKSKIILVTFDRSEELIKHRLQDRLNLYPHYKRIMQEPIAYLKQQDHYLDLMKKSKLDYLVVNATKLPNPDLVDDILKFLGEK